MSRRQGHASMKILALGAIGAETRLPAAPEPGQDHSSAADAKRAEDQPRAREEVPIPQHPAGRLRLRQQRPRRRHARPLHRAPLAAITEKRPALRRPRPGQRQRRDGAELPLPGHLPERPEPDLRPGSRGADEAAAVAAAGRARGDPRPRQVPALQLPARGLGGQAHGCDHGRRQELQAQDPGRQARPGERLRLPARVHLRQGRRPAGRSRRRLRRSQLPHEELDRARPLPGGGRRLSARRHRLLLVGRVRQPHLHLRPRPLQELRFLRCRRRRDLSREPRPKPARTSRTSPSIPTRRGSTRSSSTATCDRARSPTQAHRATR